AEVGAGGGAQTGIGVAVTPSAVSLQVGASQAFTATLTKAIDPTVTWSVQEGATCGSIAVDGLYTAPASAAICHVVATSNEDPSKQGVATVTVTTAPPPGPSGTPGVWEQLSLPGWAGGDLVESVVADPVNAGHF